MIVFFNDIPLYIINKTDNPDPEHYQVHINIGKEALIPEKLIHNVLVTGAGKKDIDKIIELLEENVFNQVISITIAVNNYIAAKDYLKSHFRIVNAAGGVVRKGDKILMIYRLKKWDLPKGKLDTGEKPRKGAVREVEEECNIKVEAGKKICNTWHTYSLNGKKILKKTNWYAMECMDDSNMKPQKDENIEEVKWLKTKDLFHGLKDSYRSVRYVFQKFKEKTGAKNIL
ncbi:MAG: NUDIX hydrolase [Bacteroidetes bacterium]|nr:NUDIX hydrolase [Bacteroidota bacterium]